MSEEKVEEKVVEEESEAEKKAKKKAEKKAKAKKAEKEAGNKVKGLWGEFKKFINRGNVVDMAVGVVIGGAFSTIVTAVVNILLSVCTWGVPGGLSGLVTVLPAANAAQAGLTGVGQSFDAKDIIEVTVSYGKAFCQQSADFSATSDNFFTIQNQMLASYKLYGSTYVYNGAAVINWGAVINAVISFLIIAIVLFVILKIVNGIKAKAIEINNKTKEKIEAEIAKKEAKETAEETAKAE